jgi:hypothetical protein
VRESLSTRLSDLAGMLHRLPILRLVIAAALTAQVGAIPAAQSAQARALPGVAQTNATRSTSPRPGVRTSAPSPAALSGALEQATGLTPSQVTAERLCPPPSPGKASCLAQVLALRSNHQLVRPRLGARAARPLSVLSAGGRTAAAVPAPSPTGVAPPLPGSPAYLQQAYDLTALSQTAGSGDTVAIVDAHDDPTAEQDLAFYRAFYGLPPCTSATTPSNPVPCFRKLNEYGGTSPPAAGDTGWQAEISLDLDAVSAICPNCNIVLIEANTSYDSDLVRAENMAASIAGVKQISNSWGGPDTSFGYSFTYPNISVVASSGDDGYQSQPGMANYPAALPGVTAAGGTTLSYASDQVGGRGFSESAWSLVGGDGASSGCATQISKPSYQHDTGCTGRSYVDISADADPATGLSVRYDGGWYEIGGTSLASPMIAAYYALLSAPSTTLDTTRPAWAYADGALLNDPITGSVGTCPAAYTYICVAGVGYDGPTGIGSISGAVAQGAPGIGGPSVGWTAGTSYVKSVGTDSVTLTAGVYPNGLDTAYHWEYGPDSSYGQRTPDVDVGAGQAPVALSTVISNLTPGATYHYRLVASNTAGAVAGYDFSVPIVPATAPPLPSDPGQPTNPVEPVTPVDPSAFAPGSLARPSISGVAREGQTLAASPGEWSGTPTAIHFQWKSCARPGYRCFDLTGATGTTHRLTHADVGHSVAVVVTASNSGGSAAATSAYTAPVAAAPPALTPRIASLKLGARSFSASRGTSLTMTLSAPATVQVVISRVVPGRTVKGRCRTGARSGRRCTIARTARSLTFHGSAGRNRFALRPTGLARGRYGATVVARAAAGASKPLTTTFTIVR